MKKRFSKSMSILSLVLALAMVLTTVGFAAEANTYALDEGIANSDAIDPAAYLDARYTSVITLDGYLRTDWDRSGCQLDTQFLTGDYLLRRLRLTFNDAYDLYDAYNILKDKNTISTVMAITYGNSSKTLRDYLSTSTYRNCRGNDGIETLQNLKSYSEYRNNSTVRRMVDNALSDIELYYAPNVRESLAFFFPESMLDSMTPQQLLQLSALIIDTPEYTAFHNSLYGHDCSTVRSLLNRGYSLDYVVRLYTSQAETAVKTIWPDYQDRMDDYWRANRAW